MNTNEFKKILFNNQGTLKQLKSWFKGKSKTYKK